VVLFNPSSGPLPEATEETAAANIELFVADVCEAWHYDLVESRRCPEKDYGDGRYAWQLEFVRPNGDHHNCEVQMIGVGLTRFGGQGVRQNGSSPPGHP
jgi:hypothetical protein